MLRPMFTDHSGSRANTGVIREIWKIREIEENMITDVKRKFIFLGRHPKTGIKCL